MFKKISEVLNYINYLILQWKKAYDCLSNPDKRAVYDKYGNEPPE